MADYPGTLPDFVALTPNPQSHAQAVDVAEECQAIVDTLGTNPQAGYGTVDARLDALEAILLGIGNTGYRNLRITNNTTTPTTKLDVTADVLACEGSLLTTVSVTIDLTVTGENGMTATRAVSTWYYVWIGQDPSTGDVCGILDDSYSRSTIDVSHASLSGFTKWRRVGAWRTNATGSGELPRKTQTGDIALYDAAADSSGALSATASTWYTRALRASVPPTSRRALVYGAAASGGVATTALQVLVSEVGVDVGRIFVQSVVVKAEGWVTLDSGQQHRWKTTETLTTQMYWATYGYSDPV